jgi:hypothetical protein
MISALCTVVLIGVGIYRYHGLPPSQATTVNMSGPVLPPTPLEPLTVSPIKLVFKQEPINKTSSPQTVTVVNRGTAPRIIAGIGVTDGTFSQTNDCGAELMVGDSCNVEVTFTPVTSGLIHGSLEISYKDPLYSSIPLTSTVDFSGSGTKPSVRTAPIVPSIAQSNSGGINVQQATTGNNSPIVNSPITVNPRSPEANWVITNDICAKILAPISKAPQIHVAVSIGAFISDPDGTNVVDQLRRCLPNVPWWNVSGAVLPTVPEGVYINTSETDAPNARSLGAGLQSAGFSIPTIDVSPTRKMGIDVSIGKHALDLVQP